MLTENVCPVGEGAERRLSSPHGLKRRRPLVDEVVEEEMRRPKKGPASPAIRLERPSEARESAVSFSIGEATWTNVFS